jgi:hypothetical protein
VMTESTSLKDIGWELVSLRPSAWRHARNRRGSKSTGAQLFEQTTGPLINNTREDLRNVSIIVSDA